MASIIQDLVAVEKELLNEMPIYKIFIRRIVNLYQNYFLLINQIRIINCFFLSLLYLLHVIISFVIVINFTAVFSFRNLIYFFTLSISI